MLKEFRQFILRGNVVDLAIGIVIGAAFKSIVDSFVGGLINPLVSFVGTGDLAQKAVRFGCNPKTHACKHVFGYGQIISSTISFVLIAAVVFFLVVKPVNHLMEIFKSDTPPQQTTRECPECLSSIPVRARRCSFCTTQVAPV